MTDHLERQMQLQEQMTVSLDSLRRKVASQMEEAYDALGKLPEVVKGKDAPTMAADKRMNRDDTGSIALGMAMDGGMGLSTAANAGRTVVTELYGSREKTRGRPQDKKTYSFTELKKMREQKQNLMILLANLGEKIDTLDAYKSCGVSHVALMTNGTLQALYAPPETALKIDDRRRSDDYYQEYTQNLARQSRLSFGMG